MTYFYAPKRLRVLVFLGIAVVLLMFVNLFLLNRPETTSTISGVYPEIEELKGKNSFGELKDYFEKLAQTKSARYAFKVLGMAPMPPSIDMHLLGHVVGDMLYKQEGLKGIEACTNDFRNACSHSIVVGLFFDKGEGALEEIAEACRKAPGGSGAYTMCFHGLGHGIVAAMGYNVPKAIELCQKTGTSGYGYGESTQCTSGIVMEMITGGGHDRGEWAKQRKKYLKTDQPIGLCQSGFMPERDRYLCYVYITPFLWESVGADIGSPAATDFRKAFYICDTLPENDKRHRDACFGGFGKEFVGLVQSRDIRQSSIEKISEGQLTQVYRWCQLTDNKEGTAACIIHAMNGLYWGGENEPQIAISFCEVMGDNRYNQDTCYKGLIGSVSQYVRDIEYRERFCDALPNSYQDHCRSTLLGPH